MSFVARFHQIRGAEKLFLAGAQGVADGLLDLDVGEFALTGRFLRQELQNDVAAVSARGSAA